MDRFPGVFGEDINTRMRRAFNKPDEEAVKEFLKAGANPMLQPPAPRSMPLANAAAKEGNITMLRLFAEHSSKDLPIPLSESTAIFDAVEQGQAEAVQLLVGLGRIDPFLLLDHAIQYGDEQVLKYLLELQSVKDRLNEKQNPVQKPALVVAIQDFKLEKVELLLEAGASVTFDGGAGTSPLQAAIGEECRILLPDPQNYDEFNYLELAPKLIQRGADPNQRGGELQPIEWDTSVESINHGATPAATAAAAGHFKMLERMHQAHPIDWDCKETDCSLLACIIRMENPANPDVTKTSILEWLVDQEHSELADKELKRPCPDLNREYLLDKKTEEDLKDLGETRAAKELEWALRGPALFIAIAAGELDTVKVLVETGKICTTTKDSEDYTAVQAARELGCKEIEKYLNEKGFN